MKQILNLLLFLGCTSVFSQVGVNTTTPNAAFDVNSATQGVLVSRVALTSKTVAAPVVNPQGGALANGTLVFNTATAGTSPNNVVPGFYYWDTLSLKWIAIASDATTRNWLLSGNTSTNPATDFLGTTDAIDLILKTNNTQRLKIENAVSPTTGTSGDILIGSTTNGTLKASRELILREDGDAFGSSILRLRNRNAENGVIYETNSSEKLVDFIFRTDAVPTALNSSNIRFETRPGFMMMPSSLSEWQFGQPPGINGGPTLILGANGTSGVTANSYFRLGNVGIGTNTPNAPLQFANTLQNRKIVLWDELNNDHNFYGFGVNDYTLRYQIGGGAPSSHAFYSGTSATTSDELMRITASGNVGIGTATPTAQLHTTGSVLFSGAGTPALGKSLVSNASGLATWQNPLASNTASNSIPASATQIAVPSTNVQGAISDLATAIQSTASNGWKLDGNTNGVIRRFGTLDNFDIPFITNNSERMRITTTGNVGIGTPTPAYKLDLSNGTFGFGTSNSRTETRDNAGLQGNAGAQSGFFETTAPTNFPTGATSWWHLIDSRHNNPTNNYALQIAGGFFDQDLWFRKTNGSPTTPWSKLLTSESGWGTTGNAGTNPATNFIGTTDARDFVVRTANSERMRISASGNVGIGNATPNAPLQFANSIQNRKVVLWDGSNNDHNYYGFGINSNILRYQVDGTTSNHAFYVGTSTTTSNELMRITGTGNVGIGVAAPAQKLDVQGGNARINNAFIGDAFGGGGNTIFSHYSQANTTGYGFLQTSDGNYTLMNKQNTGAGYLGFRIANVDQAVILNNGNMGVGTTNPSKKFTVVNGSIRPHVGNSGDAGIQFPTDPGGGSGDEAFIRYYVDGGGENTKLLIGTNNDADDDISFFQMGAERMNIYNGNVGIGTATPWTALTMGGGAYCDSFTWVNASDARLKDNIKPMNQYGLAQILQLKPVTYYYKKDTTKHQEVGFIAQDVKKVIPEVVTGSEGAIEKGETLGLSYGNLVPVLTKAIQEQQVMIEELKKKIEVLEAKTNK